jgi:hypothetical protein
MNLKKVFIFTAMVFCSVLSFSENPAKLSILVEFGGNGVSPSLNESWNIRQDVGAYSSNYSSSSNYVMAMSVMNFAVKPEIYFFKNKVALSSGLRFSNVMSDLSVAGSSSNYSNFFYLRYSTTGLNTEYVRINSISESTNYLGIPIDVKVVPFSLWKLDFYLKTGIELGYKLTSKTKIDFVNESMAPYSQSIIDNVGLKTNNLYSTWSTSWGVTFGNANKLRYNLEFLLPSFFITKNNSTIVNGNMFTGFKCSIQFPIK